MTYAELRGILHVLLSNMLGTYTGGRPAIANLPEDYPPPGVRASGLEVVIEEAPEDRGLPMHHHSRSFSAVWRVRLVQHGQGPRYLYAARSRVLERFPDATATSIASTLPDIPAQDLIEIPF